MARPSSISSKTVIRGRITAAGPLEILGHVEGHIEAQGDVTIGNGALVKSDVQGHRVVVAGAVAGNVRGAELVVLEKGARVVGDLAAPSVGIRPGALVRGHVEAGGEAGTRPAAARAAARRAPPPAASKPAAPKPAAAKPAKKAPPAPVIPRASGAAKKAAVKKRGEAPAPVVPAPRGAAKRRTTAKRRSR